MMIVFNFSYFVSDECELDLAMEKMVEELTQGCTLEKDDQGHESRLEQVRLN